MILAIETSTPRASLALLGADGALWQREFTSERAHNAVIFAPLAEAWERCRGQLDLIAVGRGPGSYGGVRVGIAVAQGLSIARGVPVAALSSLEAMETGSDTFAVVGDARRQSWFLARVEGGVLAGEPALVTKEGLLEGLTLLAREGVPAFTADPALAADLEAVSLAAPLASRLARRAAGLDAETVARLAGEPAEPHYLRAPYFTVPKAAP